jgi:hypothetical protein
MRTICTPPPMPSNGCPSQARAATVVVITECRLMLPPCSTQQDWVWGRYFKRLAQNKNQACHNRGGSAVRVLAPSSGLRTPESLYGTPKGDSGKPPIESCIMTPA